jgi:tetrahydromethanopterin S-methyltransferase subunit G
MAKESSVTSEIQNSLEGPIVKDDMTQSGLFSKIGNMVSDNMSYIYIVIGVLILGAVLYYFYIKNKNETTIIIPATIPAQAPAQNSIPTPVKPTKKVVIKHPPIEEENEYESSSDTVVNTDVNEEEVVSKFDLTQSELNQINEQLSQVEKKTS